VPDEPTTGAATPRGGAACSPSGCGDIGCGDIGCGIGGGGGGGGGGSAIATSRASPTKIVCAEPTFSGAAAAGVASGVPQRPQNAKPGGLWNPQLAQMPADDAALGDALGPSLIVPPDAASANCIGESGCGPGEPAMPGIGAEDASGAASGAVSCEPIGCGIGPLVCGATGCGAVDRMRCAAVGPDGCGAAAAVGCDPNGCCGGGPGGGPIGDAIGDSGGITSIGGVGGPGGPPRGAG